MLKTNVATTWPLASALGLVAITESPLKLGLGAVVWKDVVNMTGYCVLNVTCQVLEGYDRQT